MSSAIISNSSSNCNNGNSTPGVVLASSATAASKYASSSTSSYSDSSSSPFCSSSPFSVMMSSEDESSSSSSPPPSPLSCSASSTSDAVTSASSSSAAASAAKQRVLRKKKKKRLVESLSCSTFRDVYYLTGDVLGQGSYGRVETCINMYTDTEYAVKIISKGDWGFSRSKVLKEVELYYLCQGQSEIIQLIEYFEEPDYFYLIFEKAYGGPLLTQIQRRVHFSEEEAVSIVRDLAVALRFLHDKGIAHRDLKPENILCVSANSPLPIKLCDFDLCSSVNQSLSTPLLQSPVGSAEYMAPEVVNAFDYDEDDDEDDELTYDKRCDLWSLGVIAYILLCGYLPFSAAAEECDPGCGWERGGECLKCQRSLFEAIKNGKLVFPEKHWAKISEEAKDLISRLLVKDASSRLDANSVLSHPWVTKGGDGERGLETPAVLRNNKKQASFSRAFRVMKKSATSHDFMDNGGNNNSSSTLLQHYLSPFSQFQYGLQQQQQMPLRKTSNPGGNMVMMGNRGLAMRRQTSLANAALMFERCEY